MLLLLPSLTAARSPSGAVTLTAKFVEGARRYAQQWPGPVHVILEPADRPTANLDNVDVSPIELPFTVDVRPFDRVGDALRKAGVVLSGLTCRHDHLAAWSRRVGTPLVYTAEYSLRTRLQIVKAMAPTRVRRARSSLWELRQELRQRRALRAAAGVQCNGTPCYDAYQSLTPSAHLYFDNRILPSQVVGERVLAERLRDLRRGTPLRLAYSGRLDPMKGVQDLPAMAALLVKSGVRFTLDVFGDGPLRNSLAADIERLRLSDVVRLQGVLDFRTELLPRVSSSIDVFVCPHLQGDPSCTYTETHACGVPIVGYANEAFVGFLREGGSGWSVRLGDPSALARAVTKLARRPDEVARASERALRFASRHTFDRVFAGRVEHLLDCRRRWRAADSSVASDPALDSRPLVHGGP